MGHDPEPREGEDDEVVVPPPVYGREKPKYVNNPGRGKK